jgi:hypothetical protein
VSRVIVLKGTARDEKETFDLEIWQSETSTYSLFISYHGDCCKNITGAGIWPTLEKARQIAEQTANELLHGAKITWLKTD